LFNRIENLRDMQVTLENERDNLALAIAPAPYVTDTNHWTDLGLKHAIKKAVEAGADKFVWTPGAEQASRYSLERTVFKLSWSPDTEERAFDPAARRLEDGRAERIRGGRSERCDAGDEGHDHNRRSEDAAPTKPSGETGGMSWTADSGGNA
jgi:hypothetical protein